MADSQGKSNGDLLSNGSKKEVSAQGALIKEQYSIPKQDGLVNEPSDLKTSAKSVRFTFDSRASKGGEESMSEVSSRVHKEESVISREVVLEPVMPDASVPQARGRSHCSGKPRSKRSQTPFQPQTISVWDQDENQEEDQDDGKEKDNFPAGKTNTGKSSPHQGVGELQLPNSTRTDRHQSINQTENTVGKVDVQKTFEGTSALFKQDSRPSTDSVVVTKSPDSTAVRFTEATVTPFKEHVDIENAESNSRLGQNETRELEAMISPRGRQRTPSKNASRRSQTPFNRHRIRIDSDDDDPVEQPSKEEPSLGPRASLLSAEAQVQNHEPLTKVNEKVTRGRQTTSPGKPTRRSQTPFSRHGNKFDSDEEDRSDSHGYCNNGSQVISASSSMFGPRTAVKCESSQSGTSISTRPRVSFAEDVRHNDGVSKESSPENGLVETPQPFDLADKFTWKENHARGSREDTLGTHNPVDKNSMPERSPRGRTKQKINRPGRRNQTPFSRGEIWISDEDEDAKLRGDQRSLDRHMRLSVPQQNDAERQSVEVGAQQRPQVTFAPSCSVIPELIVENDLGTIGQTESSKYSFAHSASRSEAEVSERNNVKARDGSRKEHTHGTLPISPQRGRTQNPNRKPGKRSQTPFSHRSVHVFSSEDDENAYGRECDQSSPCTPQVSSVKAISTLDDVCHAKSCENTIRSIHSKAHGSVADAHGARGSYAGQAVQITGAALQGIYAPACPRGSTCLPRSYTGDPIELPGDCDDLDVVCRSMSRVTVASSLASENVRLFHKGTQITPSYEAGTQTSADDSQEAPSTTWDMMVRHTENRAWGPLVDAVDWLAGLFGKARL